MNRRTLIKSIFVAPIAALLGTKIVSESTPIPNTNFAEPCGHWESNFGTIHAGRCWICEDVLVVESWSAKGSRIRKGDMVVWTEDGRVRRAE